MSESSPKRVKSPLDFAFPSLFVMGLILALAVGLTAICGWKILTLDSEQEEIKRERLLLERDRDAFLTYGGELPQMSERHRLLTEEVKRLEDRRKFLENNNKELSEKQTELDSKAARLTGEAAELQTRVQTLEARLGQEREELAKLSPELVAAQKEAAMLKAQDKALSESIAAKRKQEAVLIANLEGLERSRQHSQELLAKMTGDKALYDDVEKQLAQITERFSVILGRADELTTDYGARVANVEKLLTRLDQSMTLIDTDRQALGINLEALKKDHASHVGFLKQNNDQSKLLQGQVDSLVANNKKFATVMDTLRNLDNRLQAALSAETNALKKMAQEDAQTRASLASATQTLTGKIQTLAEQLEKVKDAGSQTSQLLEKQRNQLDALGAQTSALETAMEKTRQAAQAEIEAGTKLGHTAQTLATQADIFKSRLDLSGTQAGEIERLVDNQAGRLKELATMARQLADEIGENRRRGARLEVLLGEIQNALDNNGKKVVAPAETGGEAQ